jgi:hypothetical protein
VGVDSRWRGRRGPQLPACNRLANRLSITMQYHGRERQQSTQSRAGPGWPARAARHLAALAMFLLGSRW